MPNMPKSPADLFIPIANPRSRSSSIGTGVTAETATASMTIHSRSTTPTTLSSNKSPGSALSRKTTLRPSTIRYTISAHPQDISASDDEKPKPEKEPQIQRANTVHIHRSSKIRNSFVSPIQDLTMRLSNAITSTSPKSPSKLKPSHSDPSDAIDRSSLPQDSDTTSIAPTPFSTPEVVPVPIDVASLQRQRLSPLSLDKLQISETSEVKSLVKGIPSISSELESNRPHSRTSSRSSRDRVYPPASFPSGFYHKKTRSKESALLNSSPSPKRGLSSNNSPRPARPMNGESLRATQTNSPRRLSPTKQRLETASTSSSPTKSTRVRSSSVSSNGSSSAFHTIIHHYQTCDHKSPPATRPLNVQPVLDETCDPPRSTISGACFDCDTLQRRELESSILTSYNSLISELVSSLELLVSTLESMSPVSPLSPVTNIAQPQSLGQMLSAADGRSLLNREASDRSRQGSHSSEISADHEGDAITSEIYVLEGQIAEVTEARDKEVKNVWKGYSQRWGPGTIGLVKTTDGRMSGLSGRSMISQTSVGSSTYTQPGNAEGHMRVDWIRQG